MTPEQIAYKWACTICAYATYSKPELMAQDILKAIEEAKLADTIDKIEKIGPKRLEKMIKALKLNQKYEETKP